MKSPAGTGPSRRQGAQKQVRLDLRRASTPAPEEDELGSRQRSSFWKWFVVVALLHLLVFAIVIWLYRPGAAPVPPPQFISLMHEGETVKGTPGASAAPKVGTTTPAPSHPHVEPKPPAPPKPVTPPAVAAKAVEPPPPKPVHIKHEHVIPKEDAPAVAETKPKPAPPKKVKVDLHLADAPSDDDAPVVKPKHVKKPHHPVVEQQPDTPDRDTAESETTGLSKEQIERTLGEKLKEAGVTNAPKAGISGASHSQANPFADFYTSIHDQFMDKWQDPNIDDAQAVNPEVQIHVEKDGRVPPDRITLVRSSGNQTIDDSALTAARSLGYLLQPLPDGCPPDISITLKLTR